MHYQGNIFQELKEKKVLDKDGKVDALGPYGKMKLTGQEVAQYFKKNKVKDAKVKKAVEVALDLSGALNIATKEIAKFYGNAILKNKEVQKALQYANESFILNQELNSIQEELLNEKNLMPAIQKIVSDKSASKVGGVMLDMFTASVIVKAYDAVNDNNKKKMEAANINVLVKLAHKVMGMKETKDNDKLVDLFNKLMDVKYGGSEFKKIKKEIDKLQKEELEEKIVGTGDAISKIFKTKDKKEIDGIANLMSMTGVKVLQSMQKQNPKGFSRMAAKMGELPAMEEIQEAKDLDPATVGQIASLTDRNDHNGSLMVLAKALKDKSAQKILMNIQGMHKEFGHMPDELIKIRNRVHDNLMRQSSKKFGNHKEIIGSF